MVSASLTLTFDETLRLLLPRAKRDLRRVDYPLTRRASIKDIVESVNIPHTEVGTISSNNREITFDQIPRPGERYRINSVPPGTDVTRPTLLRPLPLSEVSFLVDINVGRLAHLLRMAGFDTLYSPELVEAELAELALTEKRIVLSRNRDLLQRRYIHWGRLIRSQQPEEQLREVITLYGIAKSIVPFSRCMQCNTVLVPVEKSAVLHLLEPLTRKYYRKFTRCSGCGRIYWPGSHHRKMEESIRRACR
ncbi:MAG: Mut7-C RNAse domain-containing protein [Thermodesulfobacteriota bacterium]